MKESNNSFTLEILGTDKTCPTGEKAGSRYRKEGKIPVLSCEGACIRGEIARLVANLVAKEEPVPKGLPRGTVQRTPVGIVAVGQESGKNCAH
jgi:hypothetical protein